MLLVGLVSGGVFFGGAGCSSVTGGEEGGGVFFVSAGQTEKDINHLYTSTLCYCLSSLVNIKLVFTTFTNLGLQTGTTLQLSLQILNLLQCRLQGFLGFQGSLLSTLEPQF